MKRATWFVLSRVRLAYIWIFRPFTLGCRAIVVRGDEVLLTRATYVRGWMLPGGAVDAKETFEQAAIRETLEETGVVIRDLRLLGLYLNTRMGNSDHVAVFSAVTSASLDTPELAAHRLSAAHEIADVRFFPFTALPPDLHKGHRRRIEEFLGRTPIQPQW